MSAAIALPEDDELLAAELALGLLDDAERAAAERRLGDDPEFAAAHARWLAHGAAMLTGTGETPRPSLWPAIEARLPANDAAVAPPGRGRRFGAGTIAAAMAALLIGSVVAQRSFPPGPAAHAAPLLVAVLSAGDRGDIVTVSYDPASRRLVAAPAALRVADRVPELWVIPADGHPRSLGVIAAAAPGSPPAPPAAVAALARGVTLAVSLEPAGGSPSGAPTGPVILTGKMNSI